MKHLTEYRDASLVNQYLEEIRKTVTSPWTIMEICGGQTHSLVKNGLLNLLPEEIRMVHGPGCPVCVTPLHLIDKAIYLAEEKRGLGIFEVLKNLFERLDINNKKERKNLGKILREETWVFIKKYFELSNIPDANGS